MSRDNRWWRFLRNKGTGKLDGGSGKITKLIPDGDKLKTVKSMVYLNRVSELSENLEGKTADEITNNFESFTQDDYDRIFSTPQYIKKLLRDKKVKKYDLKDFYKELVGESEDFNSYKAAAEWFSYVFQKNYQNDKKKYEKALDSLLGSLSAIYDVIENLIDKDRFEVFLNNIRGRITLAGYKPKRSDVKNFKKLFPDNIESNSFTNPLFIDYTSDDWGHSINVSVDIIDNSSLDNSSLDNVFSPGAESKKVGYVTVGSPLNPAPASDTNIATAPILDIKAEAVNLSELRDSEAPGLESLKLHINKSKFSSPEQWEGLKQAIAMEAINSYSSSPIMFKADYKDVKISFNFFDANFLPESGSYFERCDLTEVIIPSDYAAREKLLNSFSEVIFSNCSLNADLKYELENRIARADSASRYSDGDETTPIPSAPPLVESGSLGPSDTPSGSIKATAPFIPVSRDSVIINPCGGIRRI